MVLNASSQSIHLYIRDPWFKSAETSPDHFSEKAIFPIRGSTDEECLSVCVFLGAIDISRPQMDMISALPVWVVPSLRHHLWMVHVFIVRTLSFQVRERVTLVSPHPCLSAMHKAVVASTEGNMGATVGAFSHGQSPRASHSSSCCTQSSSLMS